MRRGHKGGKRRGQSRKERRQDVLPLPPVPDAEPQIDIEVISDGTGKILGYAAYTEGGAEALIEADIERIFDRTK